MFPAARIGDPMTHDLKVPSGVIGPPARGPMPMVFIEGLPAAHVDCTCLCAGLIKNGVVHIGPPFPPPPAPQPPVIIKGSTSVFINFKPAARWFPSGDFGMCAGFLGLPEQADKRKTLIGG